VDKRIITKISDSQRDENVVFSAVKPCTLSDGYQTVRGNESLVFWAKDIENRGRGKAAGW
jgi:hypothetical protein